MKTTRMEGFSDGVFAVAITLLVLDLKVPDVHGHVSLAHALVAQWPSYAAYVISFLTIGIIWINHHVTLDHLRGADYPLLILNLHLLMAVVILPFATELMAHYLRSASGTDGEVAAAVYSAALGWMGAAFSLLNWFMLFRRPQQLDATLPPPAARAVLRRNAQGVLPYVAGIGLAFVSPYISLGISALVAFYYALPFAMARSVTT